MRILMWGRQTGKTTECLKAMAENPKAIYIAPTMRQADCAQSKFLEMFPNKIIKRGERFRTISSYPFKGYRKFILDEIDWMPKEKVEDIIKTKDVILMAGSLQLGSNLFEELQKRYPNDFHIKTTLDVWKQDKEEYKRLLGIKKTISKEQYDAEFLCKIKEV